MIDHDNKSRINAARSFDQSYAAALAAYVYDGNEEDLSRAYDCARQALQTSISIGELGELHFRAAQTLCSGSQSPSPETVRTEEFFLEAISVYDMALRGYGESVTQLTAEVQERKRVEYELRDVTFELARQRDSLDQQVKTRTRELQRGLEELRQLNSQLQQANQEQAQFTYAISHDLKSPINTIAMMLDILSVDHQRHLDPESFELIDAAQATASRMSRMINDILQYARLVGQEAEFETVSLDRLCREVRDDMRHEITDGQAAIDISPSPMCEECRHNCAACCRTCCPTRLNSATRHAPAALPYPPCRTRTIALLRLRSAILELAYQKPIAPEFSHCFSDYTPTTNTLAPGSD